MLKNLFSAELTHNSPHCDPTNGRTFFHFPVYHSVSKLIGYSIPCVVYSNTLKAKAIHHSGSEAISSIMMITSFRTNRLWQLQFFAASIWQQYIYFENGFPCLSVDFLKIGLFVDYVTFQYVIHVKLEFFEGNIHSFFI